ncbi:unnamed protein product [Phaedon cochleariae]|uniref:Uncharacterized protein n=1 Tax=Phaedon cochleariae TaxID=80249 RepID=A0A9N9X4Z1_PHACE|nr:unnamed protein product [Phaedon cochleariae]
MAGKPDLSAGPGVQNVVVYVSNDNFAQAYTVGQQNVPQNAHLLHNAAYGNPPSMAPSLGPPKTFQEKHSLKPPEYSSSEQVQQQGGYFASVISQGYANNVNYPNGAVLKSYGNGEVLSVDRQAVPVKVREDCDTYVDSGYVTVMGAEGAPHSVRCDSARSETAESSCSSLSSADEGLVIVQNQPPAAEMVVYEGGGVNSRSSGVVVALGGPHIAPQTLNGGPLVGTLGPVQKQCVMVPVGWKRLLNNGCIIYIRYLFIQKFI